MIVPLSSASANKLAVEFASGEVRKEYIARVIGEFSEYVYKLKENFPTQVNPYILQE